MFCDAWTAHPDDCDTCDHGWAGITPIYWRWTSNILFPHRHIVPLHEETLIVCLEDKWRNLRRSSFHLMLSLDAFLAIRPDNKHARLVECPRLGVLMRLYCAWVCHYLGRAHPWFWDRMAHEIAWVLYRREMRMRVHHDIFTEGVLLLKNHTIHPYGLDVGIWRIWDMLNESGIFHRLSTRNTELRVQNIVSSHRLSDWWTFNISRISLAVFQF